MKMKNNGFLVILKISVRGTTTPSLGCATLWSKCYLNFMILIYINSWPCILKTDIWMISFFSYFLNVCVCQGFILPPSHKIQKYSKLFDEISILVLHIRSLGVNFDNFWLFLDASKIDVDVIAHTEMWIKHEKMGRYLFLMSARKRK